MHPFHPPFLNFKAATTGTEQSSDNLYSLTSINLRLKVRIAVSDSNLETLPNINHRQIPDNISQFEIKNQN